VLALAGCSAPPPTSPRPTAPAILDITPAPTQNIDATATAYAVRLVPTPTPSGLYVVQPNDTLSGLAEDFGTTVEELMAANNLTDPNAIQAGQTLIIPALITNTLDLATASALPNSTAVTTPTLAATTPRPGTPTPASP
jgi:LysM repeat protein